MKKIFLIVVVMAFVMPSIAQFSRATIQASGLTCAMCSKAIDNALKEVSFVASVQPDIKNSAFNLVFKKGTAADIDALKKAVEDAGFFIARFSITGRFEHTAIKNDTHVSIDGRDYHFLNVKDQVLDGERSLVVVDRNFLTPNAFKKYSAATAMQCIKTGRAGACCEKAGLSAGTRIYHVTI